MLPNSIFTFGRLNLIHLIKSVHDGMLFCRNLCTRARQIWNFVAHLATTLHIYAMWHDIFWLTETMFFMWPISTKQSDLSKDVHTTKFYSNSKYFRYKLYLVLNIYRSWSVYSFYIRFPLYLIRVICNMLYCVLRTRLWVTKHKNKKPEYICKKENYL